MKKIVRLNENELKHMIMESVKRVLREDINTDSTNEQIYVHEDFSAGYLDKNDGNSYCCDVYRSFSANKLYEGDRTISLEDLYNICPIEIDTINNILFNKGQRLVNVYNEIYNGEKVGSEHWECGKPYEDWVEISKEPAKDKGWYEHLTHSNQMAKFRHLK